MALGVVRGTTFENPACLCRSIEQSWLRLITTTTVQRSVNSPLFGNKVAIETVSRWLSQPQVRLIDTEPAGTRDLWLRLADRNTASPKLWMDAYLAAFAISGNLRFVTNDKAFRHFEPQGLDLQLL